MLKLKVKFLDMEAEKPIIVLNEEDAGELGAYPLDRLQMKFDRKSVTTVLNTTKKLVKPGYVGVSQDIQELGIKRGEQVKIFPTVRPKSIEYIKKKMKGQELKKNEISTIIDDINDGNLTGLELGAYISAVYTQGLTMEEVIAATERMIALGKKFDWGKRMVVDKHSIGGIPSNIVTPIVVSIVSSLGLTFPKTSSRAITSPSGTADTMEVFCKVAFTASELKRIVKKTNACFVWGGAIDLAPADDKIIKAEYPLSIDPEGQVLASVMAKKKAMGSNILVVDIPFGHESKVENLEQAEKLAKKFKILGEKLKIKTECAITRGNQPIGKGIGPVLECMDVLSVLNGDGPTDLREKSLVLAGMLIKLAKKGDIRTAEKILDSKEALKKFKEIIRVQGGDPDMNLEDLLGKHTKTFNASAHGEIITIHNKQISKIARRAGAPKDKGAGIYLHVKLGERVGKGERLFTIYAEKEHKLNSAIELVKELNPLVIGSKEKVLVEKL